MKNNILEKIDLFFARKGAAWSKSTYENYRRALLKFANENTNIEHLQASDFEGWLESYSSNSARCIAYQACRQFLKWEFGALHPALQVKIKRASKPKHRTIQEPAKEEMEPYFVTTKAMEL